MRRCSSFVTYLSAALGLTALSCAPTARAQDTQQVYTDSLGAGWQNWSWCATDFASHDYAHSGASSIKATITAPYQGLYLHCDNLAGSLYSSLTFWIHGGTTNGRSLQISGIINNNYVGNIPLSQFIAGGSVAAGQWRLVTVPLSALGLATTTAMNGFWICDGGTSGQPAFYVDDIGLNSKAANNGPIAIKVDAASNRHAINPHIYGTAFASAGMLADLNIPLNRQGGNAATRYNWQLNASNHASDWYFESMLEGNPTPSDSVNALIVPTLAARAQPMVTIPTIGWVAKLGANNSKLSSFSVKKYGAQQYYDGWMPDAGNGVKSNGQNVTDNDPNDANTPADSAFQQNWVKYLTGKYGTAAKGGVSYYLLDNEPSLWHYTHRDVHPVGAGMDEIKTKIVDYAAKIKAVDSGAQIVGPEEWGWSGYFYSGYDQQYGNAQGWSYLPDRANHGGADYLPWLLSSLKSYDAANKTKSLDVFSLHYYPQGGEFSSDTSTAMQLRRNRSTRSLWDPNYVDETWINAQVQLIPRMKNWVSSGYPGLKTAITEYNWGAEGHINGATTQADILGIFGREGLDMAARWATPDPSTPTYKAMKMFSNVDGSNMGFGDVSVSDTAPDPDNVSSFAAVRSSDGALTIMLINKALSGTPQASVSLANFTPAATAQAWQLTSANTITPLGKINVANNAVTLALPAQSVTLVTVPSALQSIQNPAVFRINSGGYSVGAFSADQDYNGGFAYSTGTVMDTSGVTNPALQACYQTLRYTTSGPLTYAVPNLTPGSSYTVRLHFAEVYWTAAGQRVMNISINGSAVQNNFDLVAEAGGRYKAIVKEFTATADSNGTITISLGRVQGDPFLNALEIAPKASQPTRVNSGGSAAGAFATDQYYTTAGLTYTTGTVMDTSGVTNPAPQACYQSVRYTTSGPLTYAVPNLTPGNSYTVRLHFAEVYWTAAGQRVMNINLNGNVAQNNFDIVAEAGGRYKAIVKEFTATADSNGTITISLGRVQGDPFLNALEIMP